MPARDIAHQTVKTALIKDDWQITDDPLFIRFGDSKIYIDLGAEKVITAEKNGRKIAVEVKSFLGDSPLTEFHAALGQFLNYRIILEEEEPNRVLYLGIPLEVYHSFFQTRLAQTVIQRHQLKLAIYNSEQEEICQWIN
jgi:XisH protein